MASPSSISEDWEDVENDNLSVVSLPSSDAGSPPASSLKPDSSGHDVADTTRSEITLTTQSAGRQNAVEQSDPTGETVTLHDHDAASENVYKGEAKESQPGAEPDDVTFQDPPDVSQEVGYEAAACTLDDRSLMIDPLSLQRTAQSLGKLLGDTMLVLHRSPIRRDVDPVPVNLCERVSLQVSELLAIALEYEGIWPDSAGDYVLDSCLLEWFSGVWDEVSGLRSDAERMLTTTDLESTWSCIFQKLRGLAEHEAEMADFIASRKADLNELRGRKMVILPDLVNSTIPSSVASAPRDIS
ncbi:hypothetical protein VTK56DRAFT_3585 [Thermocarpiscus australiensis]